MPRAAAISPNTASSDVDPTVIASLHDVMFRLVRRLRKQSQIELTLSQVSALTTLKRHGAMRVGELARREQISKSSATRLVSNLERTRYVTRDVDPHDGRSYLVAISSHGAQLLGSARQRADEFLAREVERLVPADRRAVLQAVPSLEHLLALPQ